MLPYEEAVRGCGATPLPEPAGSHFATYPEQQADNRTLRRSGLQATVFGQTGHGRPGGPPPMVDSRYRAENRAQRR